MRFASENVFLIHGGGGGWGWGFSLRACYFALLELGCITNTYLFSPKKELEESMKVV